MIVLISDAHGQKLVWNDGSEDVSTLNLDEDEYDRLFSYEVSKTNEQEENLTIHDGFLVRVVVFLPVFTPYN